MALIATAETAQDIAAGLHKFLEPVSESSTEITGLIAECFAISSALRELNDAVGDVRQNRKYATISEDVRLVLLSLDYTFGDVHRIFGGLARPNHSTMSSAYRQVWRDIENYFQQQSRNTLSVRLEYYKKFLQHLICIMIEGSSPNYGVFDDLEDRIDALLEVQSAQDIRLEDDFNNMTIGPPGARKPRSFERRRPQPMAPDLPSPGRGDARRRRSEAEEFQRREREPIGRRRGPVSYDRASHDRALYDEFDFRFDSSGLDDEFDWPPAPEVPSSPTTTTSFSQSSSTSSSIQHWVPKLFEQSPSNTPFKTIGPVSACFGGDLPNASSRLAEDHEKVLQQPFEKGDLVVRLYIRLSDNRARIHCRTMRVNQSRKQCCLPLTVLRVERVHSGLKFCRTSSNGQPLELWACLRFSSYERLVLFFCTFLAMKAEDSTNSGRATQDYELRGETQVYAGIILDDHYEHALRIYKDRDSGGIRLQASVFTGELRRTPVWTAFITHHVSSRRWMRKVGPKTIHLADLQRYVFSSEYVPQLGPGGEHELVFLKTEDRRAFAETIEELAE